MTTITGDRDYRMSFNIEQLKLPPPPLPPTKQHDVTNDSPALQEIAPEPEPEISALVPLTKSSRVSDNIESIDMDMDLSDDDFEGRLNASHDNLKLIVDGSKDDGGEQFSLEPPPPLPDLPDDVDANNLLDDLSSDLHEFSNLSDELNNCTDADAQGSDTSSNVWNQTLMPPPGLSMNFREILGGPPPAPPHLLNAPPPMMNAPPMGPPPMNAPPPPPIPPPNPDLMSPPPMPMMPPPMHSNWMGKDTTEMMPGPLGSNDSLQPPWANDKMPQQAMWMNDKEPQGPWIGDEEYLEGEDLIGKCSSIYRESLGSFKLLRNLKNVHD